VLVLAEIRRFSPKAVIRYIMHQHFILANIQTIFLLSKFLTANFYTVDRQLPTIFCNILIYKILLIPSSTVKPRQQAASACPLDNQMFYALQFRRNPDSERLKILKHWCKKMYQCQQRL